MKTVTGGGVRVINDESSESPAGWYPDPDGKPADRYWDGTAWSSQTRPQKPVATLPPVPPQETAPAPFTAPAMLSRAIAQSEPRTYSGLIKELVLLIVAVVAVSVIAIRAHRV